MKFDHERLDVYHISIEYLVVITKAIQAIPKSQLYLIDQLQRASCSISLNIAEGAGEYSRKEKARFYRMARRSATESAAILDVGHRLGVIKQTIHDQGRELLVSIVSMLTNLVKSTQTITPSPAPSPAPSPKKVTN